MIENNADTNWINILEYKVFGWTEKLIRVIQY